MNKIKRRYLDMRLGQSIVFPIISMINFLIIATNLTTILEYLPLWVFVLLFFTTVIIGLIGIGFIFRKKQQPTDFKILYEQNTEEAKTNRIILESLLYIRDNQLPQGIYKDPLADKIKERIKYLKEIENKL